MSDILCVLFVVLEAVRVGEWIAPIWRMEKHNEKRKPDWALPQIFLSQETPSPARRRRAACAGGAAARHPGGVGAVRHQRTDSLKGVAIGNTLGLEFNEDLDTGSAPAGSAFSVFVRHGGSGGATRTLSGTGTVEISGRRLITSRETRESNIVRLTLDGSVINGDVVYVSYTKPEQNALADAVGNAVNSFSNYNIRNFTARDISDLAGPTFASAEVSEMTLLVTFNENLDTASKPAAKAFRVTATTPGGVARTIKGSGTVRTGESRWVSNSRAVLVANKVAKVTLRGRVFRGERVTVSYTEPEQNPLQDTAGNAVATFTGRPVTNSTSFVATRAVVISNEQRYNQVALEFDQTLNSASVPAANSFSVILKRFDDSESTYSVTDPPTISGSTVTMTLSSSLLAGVRFTVTYTKPSSGNKLQDTAGNEVQSFTLNQAGTGFYVACSDGGYWFLSQGGALASLSDVPCDMAKPGWLFSEKGDGSIIWAYSETSPEPPVNQPVESVIYTVPGQPNHRAVRGTDGNCYREERVGGKWQRSISYGTDEESCRQASWNAYNRWKAGRAMVNPDGGTFPSGPAPTAAILDSEAGSDGGPTGSSDSGGNPPPVESDPPTEPSYALAPQATPTVTGVEVSSSPASGDTYLLGETIRVTLTFSEKVDVTGSPRLRIDMDPAHWGEKWASYASGSGTDSLTFTHTVVEPNYSTQGIAVLGDSLALNGGTIRSSASQADAALAHIRLGHNADHKVDWQRAAQAPTPTTTPTPSVTGVKVSSAPASGDTYALGETIRVTLTFSEKVDVTGRPRLKIDMDPAHWGEKWASYASGSGTASLTFTHTVVEPNYSTQGIAVLGNSLALNGSTIRSSSSQADAALSHIRLGHDAGHKVDWQRSQDDGPGS